MIASITKIRSVIVAFHWWCCVQAGRPDNKSAVRCSFRLITRQPPPQFKQQISHNQRKRNSQQMYLHYSRPHQAEGYCLTHKNGVNGL
ncbi:MAG: hypothetical protein U0Z53_28350 [Blastocatellia bacterium]